jgi:hypothetical protein
MTWSLDPRHRVQGFKLTVTVTMVHLARLGPECHTVPHGQPVDEPDCINQGGESWESRLETDSQFEN